MEDFTLCLTTNYVFGRGVEEQVGKLTSALGSRALVCCGHSSARKSGVWQKVLGSLEQAGVHTVTLEGIDPNPTDDRVYEGIEICRKAGVDVIVAVGGGSVIDTAKAIALGVPYEGDFWDFYSGKAFPQQALPVGVVLTIPAAGSEGSGNSVITRLDGMHKISVRYPHILRPRFALMNPELTLSLPWYQTACGITDMMVHIFERYFSNTMGCEVTDGISASLLRIIMRRAADLQRDPHNYNARADIMWAGSLAHNGLCGCGKVEDWASHRLEHEVSAIYNVAHGAGLAVIVPAWMTFVARRQPALMRRFAVDVMGIHPQGHTDAETARAGIEALRDFFQSLGLTTSLRELVRKQPDIEALVRSLHANMGDSVGNFVKLSMADAQEIYKLSL